MMARSNDEGDNRVHRGKHSGPEGPHPEVELATHSSKDTLVVAVFGALRSPWVSLNAGKELHTLPFVTFARLNHLSATFLGLLVL
jgi:hypothetical protein